MKKNIVWILFGCVAIAIALWALVPSAGGTAWLILLMPLFCIFGHCLPSLFLGKRSCHKDSKDRDEKANNEKACH